METGMRKSYVGLQSQQTTPLQTATLSLLRERALKANFWAYFVIIGACRGRG